jgi:hypothetical protein
MRFIAKVSKRDLFRCICGQRPAPTNKNVTIELAGRKRNSNDFVRNAGVFHHAQNVTLSA